MSITDELREWAKQHKGWHLFDMQLNAIADRIDAEHERQLDVLYRDMSDAEWVRLPKDADGEYIHVGDVLDGYGKTIEVVEMRYGRSGWVLISRDGNGYADTFAFTHHAPTVEDVLREFANECLTYATCVDDHEVADAIELYAAKLRLAEEDA